MITKTLHLILKIKKCCNSKSRRIKSKLSKLCLFNAMLHQAKELKNLKIQNLLKAQFFKTKTWKVVKSTKSQRAALISNISQTLKLEMNLPMYLGIMNFSTCKFLFTLKKLKLYITSTLKLMDSKRFSMNWDNKSKITDQMDFIK